MGSSIEYNINKFFEPFECLPIINFCLNNGTPFSYKQDYESWRCWRVFNDDIKNKILNKFTSLHTSNKLKLWFDYSKFNVKDINISLTEYEDGRFLDLHKDSTSQLTTVIVLSNNFHDGRFVVSNSDKDIHSDNHTKLDIPIGYGVSFNGSSVYHGVLSVTHGVRYALNIWMTDTDFKYTMYKKKPTLI